MTEKRTTLDRRAGTASKSVSARVLALVASGRANSRAELCSVLGMAPSSISMAVAGLVRSGALTEAGEGDSTGGRRPRILSLGGQSNYVACADLGGHHLRVGIMSADGKLEASKTLPFDIGSGPEACLATLGIAFDQLITDRPGRTLMGLGISLPGPVNVEGGFVDSPSRMPGWHRFPFRDALAERFETTTVVENDANAMAVGEYSAQPNKHRQMIVVKAGTAIGSGLIIDGQIYQGANGAAGDITHARTPAAGSYPCSCGNRGCLETIASGAAVARMLGERGTTINDSSDIVALVEDAHPEATALVRDSGRHLGSVMSAIVNFFNPSAVLLGGTFSTLEPFVASFRSQLYEGCHPLVTKHLVIGTSLLGADSGLAGAGRLALHAAFDTYSH
ncbi:ROK family protein [Saxibacter everestensis]|uniref:ROK family protein n=1 Tax=Saxibacter everestensis TaxID=2909229 RepID=A0ABY8QR32_9MICO|nr:ROK family protein [Brevibacteriaceae bacterium ZFBP1038]